MKFTVLDHELDLWCTGTWLALIGGFVVARLLVWDLGAFFYKRWLRPAANLKTYGAGQGSWAVVTGASDGIGKGYATTLASRGFNVVLISRTKSKLDAVAREIEDNYKVKTKVVAVQFGSKDTSYFEDIKEALESCERIGILVNNVGVNYPFPGKYLELSLEDHENIIEINARCLHHMTHITLPLMLEKKGKGRCGILNVSSLTGIVPVPGLICYGASKAFADSFSQSLATEYAPLGIDVVSITPGMVVSNMSKFRRASLMKGVDTAEHCAAGSLAVLGKELRWSPFWVHALQGWMFEAFHRRTILGVFWNHMSGMRKRALAKLKREQEGKKTQ
ncbi:Inactive hydroxysteroid dehydrogenase-like protein 1 [Balamuthia mandrillaris]